MRADYFRNCKNWFFVFSMYISCEFFYVFYSCPIFFLFLSGIKIPFKLSYEYCLYAHVIIRFFLFYAVLLVSSLHADLIFLQVISEMSPKVLCCERKKVYHFVDVPVVLVDLSAHAQ